jgi:glycine/D-amino acid oxidase-like deaminating enzyme
MRSLPGQPSSEPAPDAIVIGAGIIGCSVAFYLTAAGRRVRVLERDWVAAGASHVAPGLLAPQVEANYDDSFFALMLAGRAVHPLLAESLREETGMDVEYRATGALRVASTEAERTELRGLLVATGHFRGGILLGPLTGRLIATMLDQAAVPGEIEPFGPDRFAEGKE